MYQRYFGLQEKPFNITPNPRFVFLSRQHREVFAHLLYGLQSRCGFIEITGEIGAGKTTILRTLFEQLSADEFRLALIFNPSLSADELLAAICREYGLIADADSRQQLLERLNRFLLEENDAGRTVVLVIDEAQNLTAPVLEQIRLLSNLETETDKLIQIVLVGQPELGTLLAQQNLRQLSQRIAVRYHLRPMDRTDTAAYIVHRLRIAGAEQPGRLFSARALRAVYRAAGGLPRLVNVLCDRALLAAYSADRRTVDVPAVKTAVAELQRPASAAAASRWLWGLALLTALTVVGVSSLWLWRHWPLAPPSAVAETASAVQAPPVVRADRLAALRSDLAALGEEESFSRAITSLASACAAARSSFPSAAAALDGGGTATWRWLGYSGSLDSLLAFNAPFLLELRLPAVVGRRYLAVTAGQGDSLSVSPDPTAAGLNRAELQALYSGRAWLPWQNFLELGSVTAVGQTGLDVRQLQTLLQQAGCYDGSPSGSYDASTIAAVTRFQARTGIVQDGRVGPLTLMLLYRHCGQFHPPRLAAYGDRR